MLTELFMYDIIFSLMEDYMSSYYELNKEKLKAKARERYAAKRDVIKQQTKQYRQDKAEQYRAYRNDWLQKHPLMKLLHNCRARSNKLGLPCDLDLDYLESLERPLVCPVLHIPITDAYDHRLTLDRITPALGYVRGNLKFISMRANRLKNESSIEELELIIKYMKSHK